MSITKEYNMYQLVNQLIENDKFKILHINAAENEVWLEKKEGRISKIIRFIQKEFDWKNHLKTDIAHLFQRVKNIRKFLGKRNIEIYNVYYSENEPVDSWEMLKKPMQLKDRNLLKMHTYYLSNKNQTYEENRLLLELNSNIDQQEVLPSEKEQELFSQLYKIKLANILRSQDKKFHDILKNGKPIFTFIFVIFNILIFSFLSIFNEKDLLTYLVDDKWSAYFYNEFDFLSFGHIAFYFALLYFLGSLIEKIFGSIRFIFILILSGIGVTIASYLITANVSGGFTGSVYALLGALLFFLITNKRIIPPTNLKHLYLVFILSTIIALMIQDIHILVHVSSVLLGFLITAILYYPKERMLKIQISAGLVLAIVSIYLILISM